MSMRPEERLATPNAFAAALKKATRQKRSHSEAHMREIIKRAAESQAEHPTEEGSLERTIDADVPVQEFEALLEEVRATMGEVGRINETLGKSLSWNSLTFQNSLAGSGRLVHVMIKPKGAKIRIRISESAGVQPALVALATVVGGTALGAFLTEAVFLDVPGVVSVSVMVAVYGAIYFAAARRLPASSDGGYGSSRI
jgi:hypothetical protein